MKNRRLYYRHKTLDLYATANQENVLIGDLSLGGCFVKTDKLLKPRDLVSICFKMPGDLGQLTLPSEVRRVVWHGRDKGYGVQFNVNGNVRKVLDAYVMHVRNKLIITVSQRILKDFNNWAKPIDA